MWRTLACLAVVLALAAPACSSSSSGDSGACDDISGTWDVTGACGPDTCAVTQTGCTTKFLCGGGSVAYSGSVSGSSVSYAGKTSAGVDGTCSGTVSGGAISGTCTAGGQSCALSAHKR